MPNIVITTILVLCVFYNVQAEQYAFSQPVGTGGGTSFTIGGDGPITAIRLWERYNSFITGIQFRYGSTWSALIGLETGMPKELELFKGETFIQVSGKYTSLIHSLVFITNKGRTLQAGQPVGNSFNMYAPTKDTELILISGQNRGGSFTFFGAHWGVPKYYV